MAEVFVVGATFRDVAIERRELLTFVDGSLSDRLRALNSAVELDEVLLLSTCNRIEVYGVPNEGTTLEEASAAVHRVWADLLGGKATFVREHTRLLSGDEAIRHAFRVMASLDSLVVGEAQILGQVKEGYRVAREVGTAGPVLRELFEQGFRGAKRVRTETEIGSESVSVGSVAVDLSMQIFEPMSDTRVLLVGAGKIARLAAHRLQNVGVQSLTVVNRTYARAEALAKKYGWRSRRFQDMDILMPEMDIVITSTGAPRPIITAESVKACMERRRYRPVFFIDLALPRDVATDVADVDRVYLYNIDDLEGIANRNLKQRSADVASAEKIVEECLEKFRSRQNRAGLKPFLTRFARHTEDIRDEEIAKAIQRLDLSDERSKKVLFQLGHNIVQRLTRGAYRVVKGQTPGAELNQISELLADSYGVREEEEVIAPEALDDAEELGAFHQDGDDAADGAQDEASPGKLKHGESP